MILLLLLSLMCADIDSVTICGVYTNYIDRTDDEIYYEIEVNDKLKLIVVLQTSVVKIRRDLRGKLYLVAGGYHAYRNIRGVKKLVIIAESYRWIKLKK